MKISYRTYSDIHFDNIWHIMTYMKWYDPRSSILIYLDLKPALLYWRHGCFLKHGYFGMHGWWNVWMGCLNMHVWVFCITWILCSLKECISNLLKKYIYDFLVNVYISSWNKIVLWLNYEEDNFKILNRTIAKYFLIFLHSKMIWFLNNIFNSV